jgi:peroxiredoxin Q/BCP
MPLARFFPALFYLYLPSLLAQEAAKIEAGKPAPDFALKDQDGKETKPSSFRGKKNVLIAFYPKDFTGG